MVMRAKAVDLNRKYTIEEFDRLPQPNDGSYYELIEGELILTPPAGGAHSNVSRKLWEALFRYDPEGKFGRAYPPGRFQFENFKAAPDLFYFKSGREPQFNQGAITVPADLAIEVWSKSDWGTQNEREVARRKIRSYLKYGFRLVWAVRADNLTVEAYHQGQNEPIQLLGIDDELDGEDIIPGFKLPVKALFE